MDHSYLRYKLKLIFSKISLGVCQVNIRVDVIPGVRCLSVGEPEDVWSRRQSGYTLFIGLLGYGQEFLLLYTAGR